ncbi:MAG: EthD domain-containing protein [Gammaproteobacteria bacterium]|nr:EthD domain-containing protein [Gammaproteobacteria bacterium]
MLELAIATTDVTTAQALTRGLGGTLYADERQIPDLPFHALATVITDDLETLAAIADVGLYLVYRRLLKSGLPAVVGLFPLIRRPSLTHREADDHWRDIHAPLALEHHGFMTHYTQLSVVHTFVGVPYDGFALCGFKTTEDLRQRFYSGPDSRPIIAADVENFADTARSPRRLVTSMTRYDS